MLSNINVVRSSSLLKPCMLQQFLCCLSMERVESQCAPQKVHESRHFISAHVARSYQGPFFGVDDGRQSRGLYLWDPQEIAYSR